MIDVPGQFVRNFKPNDGNNKRKAEPEADSTAQEKPKKSKYSQQKCGHCNKFKFNMTIFKANLMSSCNQ